MLIYSNKIRRRRRDLELSQTELARRVGLHLNTISKIERGHSVPSIDVAAKFAAALGCQAVDLFPQLSAGDGGALTGQEVP